jgi:hypothetical protein
VQVFERHGLFYSCWLPTRRRTFLGHVGAEIPNKPGVLAGAVHIDGEYVAYSLQASGDPGFDVASVISVNARTGREARVVEPHEAEDMSGGFGFTSVVEEVGVAADDAIVYLQAAGSPCPGIHATGENEPDAAVIAVEPGAKRHTLRHTLDCETPSEPVHSISELVVVRQVVSWMHSGVLHTATLR